MLVGTGGLGGVPVPASTSALAFAGAVCDAERVVDVSPERFERLVEAAIATIPRSLLSMIDNVAIVIEDDPAPDDPYLLGLYEGVPLTARDSWYVAAMPDRIRIFRTPILDMCESQADVVREVYITVVHEIAHHFGIDDATLHELGVG